MSTSTKCIDTIQYTGSYRAKQYKDLGKLHVQIMTTYLSKLNNRLNHFNNEGMTENEARNVVLTQDTHLSLDARECCCIKNSKAKFRRKKNMSRIRDKYVFSTYLKSYKKIKIFEKYLKITTI